MSISAKNPFSHLSDKFVQKAIKKSGFDPELEAIQSRAIKNAGLIYNPDDKNTAWISYHDNKNDIPVSLKHPNICFSQIFSEPKVLAGLISALVECTKLQSVKNLSHNQQAFVVDVSQVAEKVFENLNSGRDNLKGITGLSSLIENFNREFKKIELTPSDFRDLCTLKTQIPSTYTLQIHKESGHLIGISPIHVVEKMWKVQPVLNFMNKGLNEHGKLSITQPFSEFSFIIIAYKHELTNSDLTQKLLREVKTVEASYESIYKLPIRGYYRYEEMMVVKLSPESINKARTLLKLEPFSGPLSFPFAYIPTESHPRFNSLEEYMNVPGLEKYRDILASQVESHVKRINSSNS